MCTLARQRVQVWHGVVYVQDADLAQAVADAGRFSADWSAEEHEQAIFGLRITADLPIYGSAGLTGQEVAERLGLRLVPLQFNDRATLAWFNAVYQKVQNPANAS